MRHTALLAAALLAATSLHAQQVPDTLFVPTTGPAAFASGKGPRLVIDGGHVNFHTVDGRYAPFAKLAARDGYQVRGSTGPLTDELLATMDILVIANPLNPRNANDNWTLPTPSAFTPNEIASVRRWVEGGGSLLLIADHMPFAGAVEDLAAAFGIAWMNGFAFDSRNNSLFHYSRTNGLHAHPILEGRAGKSERVDSLTAFTGSAFWIPAGGAPLMSIPADARVRMPRVAWMFGDSVASIPAVGMLQGATLQVGRGRVVAAGEAAMFSAQRAGPRGANLMGFNAPTAPQNAQFVLNVLHWLSGLLPAR